MDHGGCGIIVKVEDGKIVGIKGDQEDVFSRGYLCAKALASIEKINHPARLRYPLKRVGERGENRWQRISWEEALMVISQKFVETKKRYGARAIAFCQGMPKGMEHFVLIRLANLFGSPNVVAVQDVCHAPREITGLHVCGFYPVVDLRHKSELIILWGSNITSTNEEGVNSKLLLDQMRDGTKVVVIDPVRRDIVKRGAKHLQIKPGTDLALALGLIHVVIKKRLYDEEFVKNWTYGFDELARASQEWTPSKVSRITWVPEDKIVELAELYGKSKPSAIQWGNAIEQTPFNFDTARALISLMAITGNLDVPGGNIQPLEPPVMPLGKFVRASAIPEKPKEMIHAHFGTIPRLMTVPPAFFRKAVLEEKPYPVKAVYMQCTNPLLTWADSRTTEKALKSLDFLVVADVFMTPTALYADIVLPSATQFEFNDIGHYGLGHGYILARPKIVDPPGECWPDIKILNELGKLMTSREEWYEDYEKLLEEVLSTSGLSYEEFVRKGYLEGEHKFYKYLSKGFKTPTGKVELVLSQAEKLGVSPLPELKEPPATSEDFPLILTSSKDRFFLHSSYRWVEGLRKLKGEATVKIHPQTASKYGIKKGDRVFIETMEGRVVQKALLSSDVHPDVVVASYGWWFPERGAEDQYHWKESNLNMLTSIEELGKAFGTPFLKGIPCRIGRT